MSRCPPPVPRRHPSTRLTRCPPPVPPRHPSTRLTRRPPPVPPRDPATRLCCNPERAPRNLEFWQNMERENMGRTQGGCLKIPRPRYVDSRQSYPPSPPRYPAPRYPPGSPIYDEICRYGSINRPLADFPDPYESINLEGYAPPLYEEPSYEEIGPGADIGPGARIGPETYC
ncbi:hypothetical protein GE061_019197 [Apolygus lucorum]|uniref:Uncharacterized protein n=1 Tax=Apolygus lucorum TaxID=248454 RepID=A0A8S9X7E8_APOLU|nr:hypothetical protein GE061_019197 [Apolygus lucorum]